MSRLSVSICMAICYLLIFTGCDQSPSAPPAELAGFELETVPGSEAQKAVKNENGVTTEMGYLRNDQKNGIWLTYHSDGRIKTIDHFIDGKLNGPSLTLDTRGQITEKIIYTNDVFDGEKVTYRFGRPQEVVPYTNGVIDGRVTKYYTNGKVMEENDFVEGQQHGYYRHYNEQGQMDLEYVYENGEKVSGGIVEPQDQQEGQ